MNQKSPKDPQAILILTMKLLCTYFWKTLPNRCFDLAHTNLAHLSPNRATHLKWPKKQNFAFRVPAFLGDQHQCVHIYLKLLNVNRESKPPIILLLVFLKWCEFQRRNMNYCSIVSSATLKFEERDTNKNSEMYLCQSFELFLLIFVSRCSAWDRYGGISAFWATCLFKHPAFNRSNKAACSTRLFMLLENLKQHRILKPNYFIAKFVPLQAFLSPSPRMHCASEQLGKNRLLFFLHDKNEQSVRLGSWQIAFFVLYFFSAFLLFLSGDAMFCFCNKSFFDLLNHLCEFLE